MGVPRLLPLSLRSGVAPLVWLQGAWKGREKNVRKNYAYDPPSSLLNFPRVCQELLRLLTRTHHLPPPDRELNLAEVSITVSRWKREEKEEEKKILLWCQKRYAQKRGNSSDVKDCSV